MPDAELSEQPLEEDGKVVPPDENEAEVNFILGTGRTVLSHIQGGIRTNRTIAEEMSRSPSTVSGYLERLRKNGLVVLTTDKQKIKAQRLEEGSRTIAGKFVPFELTSVGGEVLLVFDSASETEWQNRVRVILWSHRTQALDESSRKRILIFVEEIHKGIESGQIDVSSIEALLRLVLVLNADHKTEWASLEAVQELMDLVPVPARDMDEKARIASLRLVAA